MLKQTDSQTDVHSSIDLSSNDSNQWYTYFLYFWYLPVSDICTKLVEQFDNFQWSKGKYSKFINIYHLKDNIT